MDWISSVAMCIDPLDLLFLVGSLCSDSLLLFVFSCNVAIHHSSPLFGMVFFLSVNINHGFLNDLLPIQIQRFKKKRFRISSSSNYKTIVWYPSRLLTVILIGLTVYLTWWCVDNLQWLPMPNTFKQIAYTFKIDQYWRLFSPDPCTTPLWVVMPATLANGTTLDFYKVFLFLSFSLLGR